MSFQEDYFEGQACLTGDCPHEKQIDCFSEAYLAGRTDALREVCPKLERVRELLKPAYTNQAYIMIEELLKDLAEQEKEGSDV